MPLNPRPHTSSVKITSSMLSPFGTVKVLRETVDLFMLNNFQDKILCIYAYACTFLHLYVLMYIYVYMCAYMCFLNVCIFRHCV